MNDEKGSEIYIEDQRRVAPPPTREEKLILSVVPEPRSVAYGTRALTLL